MKNPKKESLWMNGFRKQEFQISGKTATIISPHRARPGRRWAWKGEFRDAFPALELALLQKGFYIVHVNYPDQFGGPDAIRVWDELYDRLTREYGFARRAALIGLSRGGLYIYSWAAAHPDRVACLYGDAPVCDLTSWPGGTGKGIGSPDDWRKAQAVFGFTSATDAQAAKISPVDQLAPLAAAGIPILHVYGDADELVPWDENTGVLAERYRALGGSIEQIAKPGVGHHPHGLEDPSPIVNFICRHTKPTGKKPMHKKKTAAALHLSPSDYHRKIRDGLVPSLRYTDGAVGPWQTKLRRKLRTLIGDEPAERCPLRVRTLWKRDHELGTIEKIAFTAEPGSDVTAYVCLPKNARPPYPFMICLQGHSTGMHNSIRVQRDREDLPLDVEGDRDFAMGCLRRGIAALCIEQRSFGERREQKQKQVSPHGCHDAVMHALMLGKTLTGERVYDVDRGLDVLAQRGDADMRRVGVMGNSGGGTVSIYAAALLPRIAFAMPSCSFCTFADSILSIYHCADNYIPGLFKVAEMADVLGLFAPKPVVIVAGRDDDIFPIRAVRRAFSDLKRIYTAAGAADQCRLIVGKGGHRFYADDAWPALLKLIQ